MRFTLLLLIITLFFISTGVSEAQTAKYDLSRLDRKIQAWIDSGFYPGASVLIVKDGKVIFEKCYGNYNPSSQEFIASAGKWLAAATIATLVDEGKLSWNDKVKKWLPEFSDVKGEATLRQLLSHTAGYPDYQPKGNRRDDYQTLRESVSHIINLPAESLPGTKFQYGGLAMQVAGRMAELAAGKDWETLFQEKIAKPLHMTSTHFTPVDLGEGHSPMLGGGARSASHDYANFLNMIFHDGLFEGRHVLSKKAIEQMQADQVGKAVVARGEFVESVRASLRKDIYGLGEWREEVDKKGKAVLISSPSWAGTYPWIDKKTGVYGILLTHVIPGKANKEGFSSFLSSAVLPMMVRSAIAEEETEALK